MMISKYLLVVIAASLASFGLLTSTSTVAADSMTVTADQAVHALGEVIGMTVSYMGGVHGDMKLIIEDAAGTVVNEWTWDHSSSDPFTQSVSYVPINPGMYTIKGLHTPHHMEPPASASSQVAVWSARINGMEYASNIDAGQPTDITTDIDYYFTQPTQIKLELWSNSENKNLVTLTQSMNGQGATTLIVTNVVFPSAQIHDLTARISYQSPNGNWMSDTTGSTFSGHVSVVPEFSVTPVVLLLLSLIGVGFLRRQTSRKSKK